MPTPSTKSIAKAFQLMEIVCISKRPLALREIASEANYSLATTHRILNTLKGVGAVHVTPDGYFQLGARMRALYDRNSADVGQIRSEVEAQLQALLDQAGFSVRLSLFHDGEIVVMAGVDSGVSQRFRSEIGGRYEAYCTAPGKVLLASLPPERLSNYLHSAPLIPVTKNTIVDPHRLRTELHQVRTFGFALDDQEFLEGVRCISVPVYTKDRCGVAALSIAGENLGLRDATSRLVPRLTTAAHSLAERLGILPRGLHCLLESPALPARHEGGRTLPQS